MSKRYEDSSDFTSDMEKVAAHLAAAQQILDKPEFAHWMQSTDTNYCQGTTYVIGHRVLQQAVKDADRLAHHLELDLIGLDDSSTLDENCQPKYER